MSDRERYYFCPESIRMALAANLVDGLRAIADAIQAGHLDGRFLGAEPHGFYPKNDDRLHIIVKVDVSAQITEWLCGADRLPAAGPIRTALPTNVQGETR